MSPAPGAPLALAVSGGPDSMAMLALGAAAFPGSVIAATVDHGLRRESASEAAMVASACAERGIEHATLSVAGGPGGDNLHAWARAERYRLLESWAAEHGAVAVATAHHADDQAETFLMRAGRAAGLSGLAGVRGVHAEPGRVRIIRPLLRWRRSELRSAAQAAQLPFVDDPSNADPRFDRARLRTWLAGAPWFDAGAVARSAEYLAEAEADLLAVADWVWRERAHDEAGCDVSGLPRGVRRIIARKGIEQTRADWGIESPAFSAASNVEALLDALENHKPATQAGVLVTPSGGRWTFAKAPPRRSH
ncbi:tRNA lysidine(34) synthetase TilS [Stakelama marina]|uniref:tRNA(Ile)-lysidine synthase n=1 Tax=Stakelama marina TaxID=2826939 RepID=A0A8T4IE41_9SPHN|nr:tRNA lysidine(34) synthetase TilS [Stakelama marina]MBR0552917.1 tRNA lysidine(34) synthetase TilS [Stakelama marina]